MSLLPLDELPGPLPAPATPVRSPSAARLAGRVLSLVPLLLIGAWAVVDWHAVSDGAARLASADPWWLLSGLFFTCLGWVAAAVVRQGAIPERLPPGPLLASQFAAGAANHVLPASIGAHAVTLRFLQRHGIPLARATASLALYSLVKPIAKTLVLLVFLVAFPDLLRLGQLVPDERTLLLIAGGVTIGLTVPALLITVVRPLRRPVLDLVRTALTDVRVLHSRPSRVLALWGGSAIAPVLQASVIASVGASLGLPLSWPQVVFAFLAASTAVGAVPAPGGIGPVDAALVFTMVALDAPLDLSTATVIGYRVLTIWLPLLPGALVLSALVHRKAL
ncbi:membrane protein [Streptomyces albiflavescens]|uniref:Membrane protein n=1 Tax=Streptomyces albiflavescens TaxID=1623582 RepID=A0A917Y7K8_9ACTN|nr:lysylphosphatidylglycerol synthase transmembrane domain-containing protein [Streptomyces albiflavescens]GGN73299.1 membrane protein [Streptomyces albiflavescens]